MLLGLSKLGCAGEVVLGKAGAVLIHDAFLLLWHNCSTCVAWQVVLSSSVCHSHYPSPRGASQIQPAQKNGPISDPSCTFPALDLVSPGVRGLSVLLIPWSLASTSRDCLTCLCTRECREEHPPLGPAACSERQSLALLPHDPPLLMTSAAYLNVHHDCGHVLHSFTSF